MRRPGLRRSISALGCAVLLLTTPAAGADEVPAPREPRTVGFVNDALYDTYPGSDSRADITSVGVTYSDSTTVTLELSVRELTPTWTWGDDDIYFWALDTTLDGIEDFYAVIGNLNNGWVVVVTDFDFNVLCEGSLLVGTSEFMDKFIGTFAASCIGSPTSLQVAAVAGFEMYSSEPSIDIAPDEGFCCIVKGATTQGYWMVASDGGIFSFGKSKFYGSTGAIKLNKPIVGMTPTPSRLGYWFVASDGGIFAYGDAAFYGSTGAITLNKPIVGMAATPSGLGYWLVASDGGIFAYGDAAFYGSTGGISLAKPITGMAATPSGDGYWFVATDGGIFAFGEAAFYGSGPHGSVKTYVGIAATESGLGYRLVSATGDVVSFGDADSEGQLYSYPSKPIVGMASI